MPLKNIINEVYSKDISRKSGTALAVKQQKGEFIGTWAAYGYRKCAADPHRIEPDPETAPVVREIFQWRLEGMANGQIARRLNERGTPSPARYHYLKGDTKSEGYANAQWRNPVIRQMLSNEVYLGHMVQGRKRSGFCEGQKQRQAPKDEWVIVRDTHEPLIDEQTFLTVQQMAQERRSAYYQTLGRHDGLGMSPNILRGLIFCADCKRPLVRYKSVTSKGSKLYYVYICPSHADDPASCPKKYLHETRLKEVLWGTLQAELALAGDLEKLMRRYLRSTVAVSREDALAREITAARQALDRAGMLHNSLFQNYADKLMTEQEYMEMKRQYRADMERTRARLEELEAWQQAERQQTTDNPWLTACGRFREEAELTEEMAHALIERVEVDEDDRVSIKLRCRDEYHALLRLLEAGGEGALAWAPL